MDLPTAVRSAFLHYADFSGRARRSEYWYFGLALFLAGIVAGIVDAVLGVQLLTAVLFLGTVLPSLALAVRRLHDTGRSGFWLFIALVPLVGGVVLLVFFCTDSERQPNAHGASPKVPAFAY